MTKKQIISFYKAYKTQILKEMEEYLDIPLKNIEKLGKYEYRGWEGDLEANFVIRPKLISPTTTNQKFFSKNIDKTYEISWHYPPNTPKKLKSPQSFLRITSTAYKVLKDFVDHEQPNIITFSGLSKGHESIYYGDTFLKRLHIIFGEEYDVITSKEESIIYIINKTVSLLKSESINKRSTITSIQESIIYWKYPHIHPSTPTNIKIKNKIKQKVINSLYITK